MCVWVWVWVLGCVDVGVGVGVGVCGCVDVGVGVGVAGLQYAHIECLVQQPIWIIEHIRRCIYMYCSLYLYVHV